MKAVAAFPAERAIRLVDDHPEPPLGGPTRVKLRILDVGVCGTDREIAAFSYGTPPPGEARLVIGHEALGEVVEAGAEVSGVAEGDLAVPMVRRPCPHPRCLACRHQRQDFCTTGDFTERGITGAHGFMTEWVADDVQYVVAVPRELRSVGVLTEPLTIAEKALLQVQDIQQRLPWAGRATPLRALVLGAGPVGLLGAMLLRRAGFEVTVYSKNPPGSRRATIVEDIGGTYRSARDHHVGGLGDFDVVYEATGASSLAFEALDLLAPNAVFVFTGIPGRKGPVEVETARIMRDLVLRNQVVFGTVNAGRDAYEAAVRDLAEFGHRWPGSLAALITGRRDPAQHAALLGGAPVGIKEVVMFG